MLLVLTIAAAVWAGYEIATRAWGGRVSALEVWAAALLLGASLWIATVWAVALAHQLHRPVLIARTLVFLSVAAIAFVRRTRCQFRPVHAGPAFVLPALPLIAWVFFLLWRTSITPPLTHDALAYHLPRAVLWMRGGGFEYLALPVDPRMRLLPANYEMLLADGLILGGGDSLTEWIAIFFFVSFVIVCGALARRWWEDSRAAFATLLLAASVPVLLLHAGADKNDVMCGFFMVSALLWGGRWMGGGDRPSLLLCITALMSAVGTKPQGLLLAVALAPFLGWRLLKQIRILPLVIVFSIAASALLGGAHYVARFVSGDPAEQRQFVMYDDWANLWQAPWVLVAAPFSRSIGELWVPWAERPWFWRRDELFFSSLGLPFVACLALLPIAMARFRRDVPERARERGAMSLAALAVLLLMLPVRDVPMPHGVYVVALPRYVLFIVPVVFGLTIAPAMRRQARPLFMALLALWFVLAAVQAVLHDRFIPLSYLQWAMSHPGTRVVAFDPRRAAGVVDTVAGASDGIAFDAGYGAWIHPAFGSRLSRPVTFIEPDGDVPDDAKWVVSDRAWHMTWQHPGFRDISQWRTHLGFGRPTAEDVRLLQRLRSDPRFELVFYNARMNQAVFRRRAAAPAGGSQSAGSRAAGPPALPAPSARPPDRDP